MEFKLRRAAPNPRAKKPASIKQTRFKLNLGARKASGRRRLKRCYNGYSPPPPPPPPPNGDDDDDDAHCRSSGLNGLRLHPQHQSK
jgi:hypothetical protein